MTARHLEETVRAVWVEHLGEDASDPKLNFFHAGGNSLLAASMLGRLSRELDHPVPMRLLARNPTLALLSAAVEASMRDRDAP